MIVLNYAADYLKSSDITSKRLGSLINLGENLFRIDNTSSTKEFNKFYSQKFERHNIVLTLFVV